MVVFRKIFDAPGVTRGNTRNLRIAKERASIYSIETEERDNRDVPEGISSKERSSVENEQKESGVSGREKAYFKSKTELKFEKALIMGSSSQGQQLRLLSPKGGYPDRSKGKTKRQDGTEGGKGPGSNAYRGGEGGNEEGRQRRALRETSIVGGEFRTRLR